MKKGLFLHTPLSWNIFLANIPQFSYKKFISIVRCLNSFAEKQIKSNLHLSVFSLWQGEGGCHSFCSLRANAHYSNCPLPSSRGLHCLSSQIRTRLRTSTLWGFCCCWRSPPTSEVLLYCQFEQVTNAWLYDYDEKDFSWVIRRCLQLEFSARGPPRLLAKDILTWREVENGVMCPRQYIFSNSTLTL